MSFGAPSQPGIGFGALGLFGQLQTLTPISVNTHAVGSFNQQN